MDILPKSRPWRLLCQVAFIFVTISGILLGGLVIVCRTYQFQALYSPVRYDKVPEERLLEMFPVDRRPQPVGLRSADDTRLRAYWMQCASCKPEQRPTLLFLHGSVGDLEVELTAASAWRDHLPIHVLFLSYRGYGYSDGSPGMKGIQMDSQAALDYLIGERRTTVNPSEIIIYGHSLGGAVALHLLTKNIHMIHTIIIENTFLSVEKVALADRQWLRLLPFAISESWDNEAQLDAIEKLFGAKVAQKIPQFLLISGKLDRNVPPSHMEALWSRVQGWNGLKDGLILKMERLMCSHWCYELPNYFKGISAFYDQCGLSR